MTDPPTAELPMGVPEADLLEQRATTDWLELHDEVDEGDLLEQTQPAGAWADDDDHPHDLPVLRE